MTRSIADILDLDRYPIADLDSPHAQKLVMHGRAQLAEEGVFLLPGFVRPDAVQSMVEDARVLLDDGHFRERFRNRESGQASGGYAWRRDSRVAMRSAGGDRMAVDSALRIVYMWDPLTDFISAVLEQTPFYRSADLMVGCMLGGHDVGDELDWHYDSNDGVVTLMVQRSALGGRFQYAPMVRPDDGDEDKAHAVIDTVMDGQHSDIREIDQQPGTLTLFNGKRSLHRVSPVEEGPTRIMLLLSYDSRPNHVFSDEIHMGFFGRLN